MTKYKGTKKNKKKENSFVNPISSSPLQNMYQNSNPIQNQLLNQQLLMQLNALTQSTNNPNNTTKIDTFLNSLSNNKIFIGFIMIMLNIGGRYLTMELPKNIDYLFTNSWMRLLIVFCISFMGTRDIKISIIITLIFVLLMKFLLHEESKICLLPKWSMNTMQNTPQNLIQNQLIDKKVEGVPLPLNSSVIIVKAK
jgi:hypothetical protein